MPTGKLGREVGGVLRGDANGPGRAQCPAGAAAALAGTRGVREHPPGAPSGQGSRGTRGMGTPGTPGTEIPLQESLFPAAKPAVGALSRSHLRNGADGAFLRSHPGLALAGFAELLEILV